MIRLGDATILAYTKLRTHKVRTGIAIAVAGLLFGLIGAVIMVAQGVFDSVDRFSDEGLNNRTILSISQMPKNDGFNEYEHRDDVEFISEVQAAYKTMVAKKQAVAKKYSIAYEAATEDPSPVEVDPATKQNIISDSGLSSPTVQKLAGNKRAATLQPFDIEAYIQPYSTAKVLGQSSNLQPNSGALTYMKDAKEVLKQTPNRQQIYGQDENAPMLGVLEASLTKPFIADKNFDASKGEIPAVFPYLIAEKTLGYKPLPKNTPTAEKLNRLSEVRSKIGEATVSYCYRNQSSLALVSQAVIQEAEIARNVNNKQYIKPNLLYALPKESDCGAVAITADTRTAQEKKQAANQILFEKEVDTYIGDAQQQKIVVRGVGISNDVSMSVGGDVSGVVQSLLGSWLGYNALIIPEDLLQKVSAQYKPDAIFATSEDITMRSGYVMPKMYLVEFANKEQARALMQKTGSILGGSYSGDVTAFPFGSGVLIIDELRRAFEQILVWVFLIVGGVAIIILGSMIGRTVAEGRRESAVFRAIGAKRSDIGAIYGMYALLLSLRALLFAAVLAIVLALTVEIMFWHEATLGARLAYAASDTTREFHLFGLNSPYLLAIAVVIIASGLIASILPIILGARRSPIKDMRDDS